MGTDFLSAQALKLQQYEKNKTNCTNEQILCKVLSALNCVHNTNPNLHNLKGIWYECSRLLFHKQKALTQPPLFTGPLRL